MKSKKSIFSAAIGLVCLGLIIFFLFTPFGVHVFGEVLFVEDKSHAYASMDYPTEVDRVVPIAKTIALPDEVKQPSGIDYDESKSTFFVVTDQSEIFELTRDFQRIESSATISDKPLLMRQGSIESTDYYQNRLYISGDIGAIEIWEKSNYQWAKVSAVNAGGDHQVDASAEAFAIDHSTGHMYLGNSDLITVLDQEGHFVTEFTLEKDAKNGRSASEYKIAGMDFFNNTLYVLTEYHSAILEVNHTNGDIHSVTAIEGITEGAGLAVTNEAFYVVVDHELTEASPGVKVYPRSTPLSLSE